MGAGVGVEEGQAERPTQRRRGGIEEWEENRHRRAIQEQSSDRPWWSVERQKYKSNQSKQSKGHRKGTEQNGMRVRKRKKKSEIPNGTIHREATCHAEERKTKDDRGKEEGQRVDFWSNQCGNN